MQDLNTPHVAGLDKTVGILLDADSLEMVAYKEFAADKVVINCIQASDGQSRILVSKPQHIKEYQHRKFSF